MSIYPQHPQIVSILRAQSTQAVFRLALALLVWGGGVCSGSVIVVDTTPTVVLETSSDHWPTWITQAGTMRWAATPLGRSVPQRCRIRNIGSFPTRVSGVEIAGASASRFVATPFNEVLLPPQQSVEFDVVFTPETTGTVSATLRVLSQDGQPSLLSRSVEGSGKLARVFELKKTGDIRWQNNETLYFDSVTLNTDWSEWLGTLSEKFVQGVPGFGGPAVFRARIEGPDANEFEAFFYDPDSFDVGSDLSLASFDYIVNQQALDVGFSPITKGPKEAWLVIEELPLSGQYATNTTLRLRLEAKAEHPGKPRFVVPPKSAFIVTDALLPMRAVGGSQFRATILRDGQVKGRMVLDHPFLYRLWDHEAWDSPCWGRYRIGLATSLGSGTSPEFWLGQITTAHDLEVARLPMGNTGKLVSKARAPALKFQWMRNGVPLLNGDKYAGTTSRELNVKNVTSEDAGSYVCRLTMPAPDGPVSVDDLPVRAVVFERPVMTPFSLRPTHVHEAHEFHFSESESGGSARSFLVEGLPPGLRFAKGTGYVWGRISPAAAPMEPRDYVITVRAENAAGVSEPFVTTWRVEPYSFRESKGVYDGLFSMDRETAGGRMRLVLDGKGGFSGKVWRPMKGETRAVRGLLLSPGVAGHSAPPVGGPIWPNGMTVPSVVPIGVAFYRWDREFEEIEWLTFTLEEDRTSGAIISGSLTVNEFFAVKQAAPPAAAAGLYHLQIGGLGDPPDAQSLDAPGGIGFAQVRLAASGLVRCSGRLGDGSVLNGSASGGWLREIGQWLVPIRQGRTYEMGVAQGWVTWLEGPPITLAGEWQWLKPKAFSGYSTAAFQRYPDGYWLPQVPVLGSRFTVPTRGELAFGWSVQPEGNEAELWADSAGWTNGGPEKMPVRLGSTGLIQLANAATGVPWRRLKARLVPTSGLLSGDFERQNGLTPTKALKVPFQGLWMPHLGQAVGVNWMTPPALSTSSQNPPRPIVSGTVRLTPDVDGNREEEEEPVPE